MNFVQNNYMTYSINANDKLSQLEPFPLTHLSGPKIDEPQNDIERSAFMSMDSSIGWIGLSASPFFAFYASNLQQMLSGATVASLTSQANALRQLKKLGTRISFPRAGSGDDKLFVTVFADAGGLRDHGQLAYVAGFLLGPLWEGFLYPLPS